MVWNGVFARPLSFSASVVHPLVVAAAVAASAPQLPAVCEGTSIREVSLDGKILVCRH